MLHTIIVEDEPTIAKGLALMLEQYSDIQVIAICYDGLEGYDSILKEQPDLVFTDINMPAMDGLEMVRQIQHEGMAPQIVILTGYAEFEYARTAIQLGVSDYLLKPVSIKALDKTVNSCREQIMASQNQLRANYLQQCIFNDRIGKETRNPLLGYNCVLLVVLTGAVRSNIYTETILSALPVMPDLQYLENLKDRYGFKIYSLKGQHSNECVYALIFPQKSNPDILGAAKAIFDIHSRADTFVNMILSHPAEDGREIFTQLREAYMTAFMEVPFGGTVIKECGSSEGNRQIGVSDEIQRFCSDFSKKLDYRIVQNLVHSMCSFWEENHASQFQIMTDLRYLFSMMMSYCDTVVGSLQTSEEIVTSCNTYEDLEREIICEITLRFHIQEETEPRNQHELANQVRSWLDKHFTEQITYKIFQDLFHYNEKYISSVFKEEFGISPSKYIGELRIDMAKKLMDNNADILLKDVSEMTGFTDAFYFSRVFKSHEGITPSKYLQKQKNKNNIFKSI